MAKDEVMEGVKGELIKQVDKAILEELDNIKKGGKPGKGGGKGKGRKKKGKGKGKKHKDDDDDDDDGEKEMTPEQWLKIDKAMPNGKSLTKKSHKQGRDAFYELVVAGIIRKVEKVTIDELIGDFD